MRFVKLSLGLSASVLLAISSASCNSVPDATGCSELARTILKTPTPHADIGDSGDADADWKTVAIAESGQLRKANDDKSVGFDVIAGCEARDERIRQSIERDWWPFW